MSYIDKNLMPEEQIVYRTKKHVVIFIVPFMFIVATLILLMNSNSYVVMLSVVPGLAALVTLFNALLVYLTADFAVTNKRILMKEGFFVRHSNETRLVSIANVSTTQSLVGQFLDYGAVFVNVFGGATDSFTDIAAPNKFKLQVQEQLDKLVSRT